MPDIIARPQDMSAEWLTEVLTRSGHLGGGSVSSFEHKIIGTGKMVDNARYTLQFAGERGTAPDSLIIKFPAEDETARAMAGAQGAYYNEVMFYRHLADRTSMRTPTIYANQITDDRMLFITAMDSLYALKMKVKGGKPLANH